MNAIEWIEQKYQNKNIPSFKGGDQVRVHVRIKEGEKERTQVFEGVVIGLHRAGGRSSFTVRKISYGLGVERVFPFHAPVISKIEVVSSGKVRRAKLYYLRKLSGKKARITTIERERGVQKITDNETTPMAQSEKAAPVQAAGSAS